ncbi:hypothetical protein CRENBAI_000576 [Crenichthys baileyi]|uniref:Uncharacterized protein n=1 Tax=Crenichthys baileyi TaxID=28760 RepID=A0AAV9SFP1_9TELE
MFSLGDEKESTPESPSLCFQQGRRDEPEFLPSGPHILGPDTRWPGTVATSGSHKPTTANHEYAVNWRLSLVPRVPTGFGNSPATGTRTYGQAAGTHRTIDPDNIVHPVSFLQLGTLGEGEWVGEGKREGDRGPKALLGMD